MENLREFPLLLPQAGRFWQRWDRARDPPPITVARLLERSISSSCSRSPRARKFSLMLAWLCLPLELILYSFFAEAFPVVQSELAG